MFRELQFKGIVGKDIKEFLQECIRKDTESGFLSYTPKIRSVNIFNPKKNPVTTIIIKIQEDENRNYRCIAGRVAEKYKLLFLGDHLCSGETLTFKSLNPDE